MSYRFVDSLRAETCRINKFEKLVYLVGFIVGNLSLIGLTARRMCKSFGVKGLLLYSLSTSFGVACSK